MKEQEFGVGKPAFLISSVILGRLLTSGSHFPGGDKSYCFHQVLVVRCFFQNEIMWISLVGGLDLSKYWSYVVPLCHFWKTVFHQILRRTIKINHWIRIFFGVFMVLSNYMLKCSCFPTCVVNEKLVFFFSPTARLCLYNKYCTLPEHRGKLDNI